MRRGTAGNPFFVLEMMRHLAESGFFVQDGAGRWFTDSGLEHLGLPESVREVISQRVSRLGDDVARVLTAAAVIGPEFDLDLLGTVTETDPSQLLEMVERAQLAALTEETADVGRFAFSHGLVQHALDDELSSVRRQRTHRRIAESLEQRVGDDPDRKVRVLAHHWARTDDHGRALLYADEAGRAARRALAPDEAALWFNRALQLKGKSSPEDTALECDLLVGLGTAQRTLGDASHRETLLRAHRLARTIDDPARMAAAALASYRGFWSAAGRVDEERVDALEAALSLMSGDDSHERARILATLCNELDILCSATPAP